VLPLANLSGHSDEEYFADGMTDALITSLSKIGGFRRVISRTSVMGFKGMNKPMPEIARALGVETIVEGSVLRSGGRVRIAVQLVRAATEEPLWAEPTSGTCATYCRFREKWPRRLRRRSRSRSRRRIGRVSLRSLSTPMPTWRT
jgi:TolB-like protein